jgi:hypothetical protein
MAKPLRDPLLRCRGGATHLAWLRLFTAALLTLALVGVDAAAQASPADSMRADVAPAATDRRAQPSSASGTDSPIDLPSAGEVERKMAPGEELDGEELYDRFLENRRRLRSAFQRGRILSSDPGGNPQRVDFWLEAKDYRDDNDDPVEDIYGKVVIKIVGPNDLEHTGYLYIHRDVAEDEQFMYSPHRRRTARIALKGQRIAGSDFSFDDFLVNLDDLEDGTYQRHPDEEIDGVRVYVVEARMSPESKSSYTRSMQYLETEHYVPLRARYWDEADVESKELVSPHASIREFDGVWIAVEATMTDLLERTSSTMYIDELDPNAEFDDSEFALNKLQFTPGG